MFNLVIVVISIALVSALAVAGVYFGGDAFESGGVKAEATRYINESQQITAAAEYFRAEGGGQLETLDQLVDEGYMSSMPDTGSFWRVNDGQLESDMPADRTPVCQEINVLAGIRETGDPVPTCQTLTDEGVDAPYFCCTDG
jgi:hypothetical protein